MRIKQFVCPCCGRSSLVPPNRSMLGYRFGVNSQGIEYYLSSVPKWMPYTICPKSSYHEKNKPPYTTDLTHYSYIKRYSIVLLHDMRLVLNEGKLLKLFNPGYAFRCGHCKAKISLNYNPISLFWNAFFWVVLLVIVILFDPVIMALFCVPFLIVSIVGYICVRNCMSNFVTTDIDDNYIVPTVDLSLKRIKGAKMRFCHLSNIYSVSIEGQTYYLYIVKKEKSLIRIHICADESAVANVKQYFRNATGSDRAIVELHFEGKYAGVAEVSEIVD